MFRPPISKTTKAKRRVPKLAGTGKRTAPLLLSLSSTADGLTLREIAAELGESGRIGHSLVVRQLRKMRQWGWVHYAPAQSKVGGVYFITSEGSAWLRLRTPAPHPETPLVLTTGSMQGEVASISRSVAVGGQAPAGIPCSVFDLANVG